MTMVLVVWLVLITALLFGDTGLAALQSGMQKVNTRLETRKEKRKAIESHVDEKTGDDLAHKIRAAEIEAEMHLQGNGFVLTACENPDCHTCNPAKAVEADVRTHDKKTYAGWPGTRSEYEAYLEEKRRPKALNTTAAGAAAKGGGSSPKVFREEYTIVSGAGERIASTMYDYIIVNHQSYPRPSEVPDYADVEIRNYWDENFLVWTWLGNYQGRTVEMYYKQPM